MQGYARHGLIHCSQVADDCQFSREDDDDVRLKALEHFAPVGSDCWVKVLEVRDEPTGPKVSCSMRAVDQADGRDLGNSNPRKGGRPSQGGSAGAQADARGVSMSRAWLAEHGWLDMVGWTVKAL